MKLHSIAALASVLALYDLGAQQTHPANAARSAVVVPAGSARFGPAPDILPSGATLAVLEGDPTKTGTYVMRLSMPDGYTIPPHFHPADEHVTVLEGTFLVGMGATLDPAKFSPLPPGSFGMLPVGMKHFARAKGPTVIQLHGTGPWSLSYVNPADDPRKRAR